jgi:hypothetical protein
MLNLGGRNPFRHDRDRDRAVRPMSAERRLGLGLDHRTRRVQKSLFGFIFASELAAKEDIPLRVMHSQSERARYVNRYGAWVEPLSPEFRRFFHRWFVLGKTNPAPIHKSEKHLVVK